MIKLLVGVLSVISISATASASRISENGSNDNITSSAAQTQEEAAKDYRPMTCETPVGNCPQISNAEGESCVCWFNEGSSAFKGTGVLRK